METWKASQLADEAATRRAVEEAAKLQAEAVAKVKCKSKILLFSLFHSRDPWTNCCRLHPLSELYTLINLNFHLSFILLFILTNHDF